MTTTLFSHRRVAAGVAGLAAVGAMAFAGAGAANAAPATTVTSGHTDIVSVSCSASGVLTVDTYREADGHIAPGDIGDWPFLFDDLDSPVAAISYASNTWTVSGGEQYEDEIPFIGFQYASAGSAAFCPSSVSFDVSKSTTGTNTGDAVFTANDAANGSTSSAAGDTNKVTLYRPGSGLGASHEHGQWTFNGPSSGGDYTLRFETFRGTSTTPIATVIDPVHIHVQP